VTLSAVIVRIIERNLARRLQTITSDKVVQGLHLERAVAHD
jgi:hypothetical protein